MQFDKYLYSISNRLALLLQGGDAAWFVIGKNNCEPGVEKVGAILCWAGQ